MLGAKACTSLGLVMPLESLELDLRSVAGALNHGVDFSLEQALAQRLTCFLKGWRR